LAEIAGNRGVSPEDLKFNKAVCRELGEGLVGLVQTEKLDFVGDLATAYEKELEGALHEIYAEAMKMAIVYPEQIKYNPDVMAGVSEILTAINGEPVSLEDLQSKISHVAPDVVEHFNVERVAMEESSSSDDSYISEEGANTEEACIISDNIEMETLYSAFETFVREGVVPESLGWSEHTVDVLQGYASVCAEVTAVYPELVDTDCEHLFEDFDPPFMHIWEILAVEDAIETSYIRFLVDSPKISDEELQIVREKTATLRNFVQAIDENSVG
jgi:hypothetical protein